MGAQNKTQRTDASVSSYLAAIVDQQRRDDCQSIARMMSRVTGEPAHMFGAGIVGFGSYHYRYDSGREGDAPLAGFASRKSGLTLYLMAGDATQQALLENLGRHKMGKGCLTLRRLSDVDSEVLEALVANSVTAMRRRYPGAPS